jgi:hypothetical protein
MATLLKVLINLADIKSAEGVALRVGIQGGFWLGVMGSIRRPSPSGGSATRSPTCRPVLPARYRALDENDRANQRPAHVRIDRDVDNGEIDINVRPDGTSLQYALRRLRKHRPDILATSAVHSHCGAAWIETSRE